MSNKLYDLVNYRGEQIRVYNEILIPANEMLYSELEFIFETLQKQDYTFFLIENTSNNNIILNNDDFYYLENYRNKNISQNSNYIYPKNIEFIKKNKLKDLIFFENFENIEFIFFIPKLEKKNFYYQIILGFKNKFNLDRLISLQSSLVSIKNIIPFKNIHISFNWIKKLFNIENNIFHEVSIKEWELSNIYIKHKNQDEWPEYVNFKRIQEKFESMKDSNIKWNFYDSKEYINAEKLFVKRRSQETDWRLYKKLKYQFLSINFFYADRFWCKDKNKPIINRLGEIDFYLKDEFCAATNFYEITNVKVLNNLTNSLDSESEPCWYSLNDLISFNAQEFGFIYDWMEKDLKLNLDEK